MSNITQLSETLSHENGWVFSDNSSGDTTRVVVTFPNELKLSIIQGPYTYGGPEGFFEIAVFDRSGEFIYSVLPGTEDSVVGWLTMEEVFDIANHVASLEPGAGVYISD